MKRIIVSIVICLIVIVTIGYFWLRSSKPQYSGSLAIKGIEQTVHVHFDEYGIPHIYAENKHDLYKTFGYLHAQDRLFQMEMMRRAGSGTLAEVIGRPMLKVDKLFRTIGLVEYAKESAQYVNNQQGTPMYNDLTAYLEGINEFIAEGPTPPEFSMIGIEKRAFTIEDVFYITGAMSFNFSQAQRSEPVIDYISRKLGKSYLDDLGLWHHDKESFMRTNSERYGIETSRDSIEMKAKFIGASMKNEIATEMALAMQAIEEMLPIAPLEGSNAWVIGGNKTKSGEVIFCNDTHIGYMLPQTWYEAHLNAPGFEMYGHFMAGLPFALVGRNGELSWGLTMLLNDDMDFYYEKPSPENSNSFLQDGSYYELPQINHLIKIKGEKDTTITVVQTKHGPVVSNLFDGMENTKPISMYWSYTKIANRTIDALYGMNNAQDLSSFEQHLDKIHGPGLNVNYGDKSGNIAWWGCAALIQRNDSVNSFTILDGSDSYNDPLGFYSFEINPRCINPEWGYIYSANDWPQALAIFMSDTTKKLWYPGYYKPQYRADRIRELIESKNDWGTTSVQAVMTDHQSRSDVNLLRLWKNELNKISAFNDEPSFRLYDNLFGWNGNYEASETGPTFYNKMLYHYWQLTVGDELGKDLFAVFLQTHHAQRSHTFLFENEHSPWWDNVNTNEKETRQEIIYQAYCNAIDDLVEQFGDDPLNWQWEKACSLELKHPLGEVAMLKPIFNIAERFVYGGNETILQSGFRLDSSGVYKVFYGSQMRIILDFAFPDSALNVTPSGNSGHVLSAHYDDQAALYREMKFRPQLNSRTRIVQLDALVIKGTK